MQADVDRYHDLLFDIWSRHAAASTAVVGMNAMPYLGQAPLEGQGTALTFLGINPSFVPRTLAEHWSRVHGSDLTGLGFRPLMWDATRTPVELAQLRAAIVQLDRYSHQNYGRYYGVLRNMADAVGAASAWHALDVFPLRVTAQAELRAVLPLTGSLPPAIAELFDGFCRLLRALAPQVVVVANAHAARFLVHRAALRREPSGHRYSGPMFPGTQFLMSGMLSGAAALDEFSRERLTADVAAALAGRAGLA